MNKVLWLDLETTGVMPNLHGVHQMAGLIEIDGKVEDQFNFHVQPWPLAQIIPKALEHSGVTLEQIRQYPPMAEVGEKVLAKLGTYVNYRDGSDKYLMAGYGVAGFDSKFFDKWLWQATTHLLKHWFHSPTRDVLVLATEYLIANGIAVTTYQQSNVAKVLGLDVATNELHDAEYDVSLSRNIYNIIQPCFRKTSPIE